MTWDETSKQCPPGVTPACHNAEDAVTISGPKEAVGKFVEKLKKEGVFARTVNTGGVAFHSKAMQAVAPQFKKRLESVSIGAFVLLLFFSVFLFVCFF